MKRLATAIGRAGRRAADLFPLTPLGLLGGLGAWGALEWLAYPELDLVWLVVGYAALGMIALALVGVCLAAMRLKLGTRIRARPEEKARTLETDRSLPTGFSVPGLRFLPLLQVDWSWVSPDAVLEKRVKGLRIFEDAALPERGRVREVVRRITVRDAFGLCELAIRSRDPRELVVLPSAGALREMPVLVSLAGGDELPHPMGIEDGDRVELRRYVPGDPARFIHWKVYARTRKLMVRVPERALSSSRRTVAYLCAGAGDEASSAAARVAVEAGTLGAEWIFGADGSPGEARKVDEALSMIVRSAEAKADGARGLEPFLARAERAGPASAVIFVPPRPGPWLDRVLTAIRVRRSRTKIVIGVDGIAAPAAAPLWRRALLLPAPREGTPAEELDRVVAAFASLRCEVVLLDRRTGRRLGDRHRAGMRALGAVEDAA